MPPPRPTAFILNLPFDLTSDIFERVSVQTFYPKFTGSLYRNDFAPLKLAAVCTQWRSVALSTHTLWATLILDCTTLNQTNSISLVDMWLSRAGEAPLALYLRLPRQYADSIISRLLVDAQRWKCLQLETYGWPLFLDRFPRELDLLEEFGLYGSATASPAKFLQEIAAPRLRKLCVDAHSNGLLRWRPVHQLTTLELGGLSVHDSVNVLKQTPNLQTLRFYLTFGQSSESIHPNQLSLHHLTTLQLLELTWQSPIALMSHLTLPSLTHIILDDVSRMDENSFVIQSFLGRSACSIQELTLQDATLDAIRQTAMIFPSLPALVVVPRAFAESPESIRDLFTLSMPPLFRELRSLTIGHCGGSSESDVADTLLAFIDLVSIRSEGLHGAARLKSFKFDSDGVSEAVLRRHAAELKALVDECGEDCSLNFGRFTGSRE
ncbi:hypothetical protein C8F01DRAFT_268 [Mycena amicta]|nr:hypothetical protein C8F01DRAFT_268 [Mycena amicta]